MSDFATIIQALADILNELRAFREELVAAGPLRPGGALPSVPSAAAHLEAAAWAQWGIGLVPASAYAALPPEHPVACALASFARARGGVPPVGTVAVGALLSRAAALPGSRYRYRRLTSGGRWRLVPA